jgi:hypothetical protein
MIHFNMILLLKYQDIHLNLHRLHIFLVKDNFVKFMYLDIFVLPLDQQIKVSYIHSFILYLNFFTINYHH